ncbi:GT-D fold domain-containing glycosyltransferase [Neobacillus drentensis]|uniref:GT-D fold domain-containing glycosyltransferase n=1 Tax=Neobacillus drentensis TaxID=220684 RepID=UPI0030008A2F
MKVTTNLVYTFNRLLRHVYPLSILDTSKSINFLLDENCSLARYGDGELNIMMGGSIHFQEYDAQLSERLTNILVNNDNCSLEIGVPLAINTVEGYRKEAKDFWNMNMDTGRMHWVRFCGKKRTFLNASLTRCYIDYEEKSKSKIWFKKLTNLWQGKRILIVEGKHSRLGVDNTLFSNTNSIGRIICPSNNAWSVYNAIKLCVLKNAKDYDLVLVSLGPTATVLADDISREGVRIVDIGHLNLEYNKFIEDGGMDNLHGKIIDDSIYRSQIVATI